MNKKQQENFWKKVKKTNNCWLWLNCKDKDGYGVSWISVKVNH